MLFIDKNNKNDLQLPINILNEVYFGKIPYLQEIENKLDKFRNKYMGCFITFKSNNDPDLLQINRMFEKLFGFGSFCLYIVGGYTAPNAFTFSLSRNASVMLNHNKNVIMDKNGYRFNKKFEYSSIVFIYTSLIFNNVYTTKEIMACILHEIGHNFESNISNERLVLNTIYEIAVFSNYIISHDYYSLLATLSTEEIAKATNNIKKSPLLTNIFTFILTAVSLVKSLKLERNKLLKIMSLGIADLNSLEATINKLVDKNIKQMFLLYTGELTADKFPTMYGYGSDMISLLGKFQDKEKDSWSPTNIIKIRLLDQIIHLNEIPTRLLMNIVDCHPLEITRCMEQIAMLENELSKENIDPKLEKTLREDLKTCKKSLNKLKNTSDGLKDPYIATKILNSVFIYLIPDIKYLAIGNRKFRFKDYDKRALKLSKRESVIEYLFMDEEA